MYPRIYSPFKNGQLERLALRPVEDGFICRNCQAFVSAHPLFSGVHNRNHCPYCLWSRHVDWQRAGDRLSACKASMEPIGLTVKQRQKKYASGSSGELMLIHRCNDCGRISINRIAADDLSVKLWEIFNASTGLDSVTRIHLEECGIWLLQRSDYRLVSRQLSGTSEL